ncbi:hypothetical protein GCM10022223_28820 [Kineosporia mesophila]|uniref:Uncharacterized protein n=1 Tax=Kineosporia mesophila TaxID=566012 RepID=A0ABP6ZIL1_9ACTN
MVRCPRTRGRLEHTAGRDPADRIRVTGHGRGRLLLTGSGGRDRTGRDRENQQATDTQEPEAPGD